MNTRATKRRLELLVELRRDLPRYAQQRALYLARSRRDSSWLDTPQVVSVAGAVGSFSVEVVPRDDIGRFLYVYGMWDLLGTRLLQRFLRPGMTVLDIGANIGYFSLVAASLVGPTGVVHSFEPHDEIRERLPRNAARNGFTNIRVRSEAVARRAGEVRFYRSADSTNQGISSTVQGPAPHGEPREEVPVIVSAVTLDGLAAELGRVDLVKLDVEGAEREALEGGGELLSGEDAPLVVFEAYDVEPTRFLLEQSGYTVRRLDHDRRRGIRLSVTGGEAQGEPNYVASKQHHEPALAGL